MFLLAVAAAHKRDIVKGGFRAGHCLVIITVVITLKRVVAGIRMLLDNSELDVSGPAPVPVNAVVSCTGDDDVFEIDIAAKHLNAIVERTVNLHISDNRVASTAAERQTVQFVVFVDFEASEFDAGKFYNPTGIFGVGTAKCAPCLTFRKTFDGGSGLVHRRLAKQNNTAPVATRPVALSLGTRKYNRLVR